MATGPAYESIASQTLASGTTSITFNSIPADWTDLRIVFTGAAAGNTGFWTRFNNDSSALYSQSKLDADGSAINPGRNVGATELEWTSAVNINTTPIIFAALDVFSYAGSTYKTSLMQLSKNNNASGYVARYVGLYRSTSAITRIDLIASAQNFSVGTTATLFGIKAA
jgi:hypothetical protein